MMLTRSCESIHSSCFELLFSDAVMCLSWIPSCCVLHNFRFYQFFFFWPVILALHMALLSPLLFCFTILLPELFTQMQKASQYFMNSVITIQAFAAVMSIELFPVATCNATQQSGVQYVCHIAIWAHSYSVGITPPLQGWYRVGLPCTRQHVHKKKSTLLEAMMFISVIINQRL